MAGKHLNKIPSLYYYTTIETMRFILQNGNIYATNLRYMNDAEEYSNGLMELQKIFNTHYVESKNTITAKKLDELLAGNTDIYSISFSTQRDLLSQWSMYAGESGVSLKMDFHGEQKYWFYSEKENNENKREYYLSDIYPKRVFYLTQRVMKKSTYDSIRKKIISEIEEDNRGVIAGDMQGENAINAWLNMTPYVKRYEFYQEGEYRLACSIWDFPSPVRIDYRNDRNVLKPYLDVECENGWPIEEIIVGPGFNQQAVYTSLKHYISNTKIKVPILTRNRFKKRCKQYFCQNNKIPGEVEKIWLAHEREFRSDEINSRYRQFEGIKRLIMEAANIDDKYKEYLSNRYLSKEGILVTKSEIPYQY